jgi:hypothetical protein
LPSNPHHFLYKEVEIDIAKTPLNLCQVAEVNAACAGTSEETSTKKMHWTSVGLLESAQWSRGDQCATERSNRRLWAVPKGFGQYLRALGKYLKALGSTRELWAVKAIGGSCHSFAPLGGGCENQWQFT